MPKLARTALLAGLCGGLAEMAWIAFYSSVSSTSAIEVARAITASVFAAAGAAPWATWAGVGIHLALSLALGLAFALALWTMSSGVPGRMRIWVSALSALAAVWAVNFLLVLPVLNSSFISLMPYGASLLSKMLFGIALAWVLTSEYHGAPRAMGPFMARETA
jgi:hypothetical protein